MTSSSTPDRCVTAHCSEALKIATRTVTAAYCMSHVELCLPREIIKSEMRPSSRLQLRRLERVCEGSGLSFEFLANRKRNATSLQQLQRRGHHTIRRCSCCECCKRLRVNSTHINQLPPPHNCLQDFLQLYETAQIAYLRIFVF